MALVMLIMRTDQFLDERRTRDEPGTDSTGSGGGRVSPGCGRARCVERAGVEGSGSAPIPQGRGGPLGRYRAVVGVRRGRVRSGARSEERRVGKGWRARWAGDG